MIVPYTAGYVHSVCRSVHGPRITSYHGYDTRWLEVVVMAPVPGSLSSIFQDPFPFDQTPPPEVLSSDNSNLMSFFHVSLDGFTDCGLTAQPLLEVLTFLVVD